MEKASRINLSKMSHLTINTIFLAGSKISQEDKLFEINLLAIAPLAKLPPGRLSLRSTFPSRCVLSRVQLIPKVILFDRNVLASG